MLEDMALQYVSLSEADLRAIGYGLAILGGIIAGVANKSRAELARAPYFACLALIFLLMSATQVIWLQSPAAMAGGYLWVLMAVSMAASIIGGFFLGKIAIARSRDAFGHGWMAALGFIPLANLWLMAKASRDKISANRAPTIPLLTGGLGVVSGFVMLIAAVMLTSFIEHETSSTVKRAQSLPAVQQAGIDGLLRSQGLEKTLHLMVADVRTPIKVDDITTLARIEAAGGQLRRTYVVVRSLETVTDEFRGKVVNGVCAYGPFIALLRAGGSVREVYVKADGSPIGAVLVTRDTCGL